MEGKHGQQTVKHHLILLLISKQNIVISSGTFSYHVVACVVQSNKYGDKTRVSVLFVFLTYFPFPNKKNVEL
jgi:hypothetical protein